MNHGLVRHHFGSKEGVWRAVVEAADAEYVSAMRPVVSMAGAYEDPRAAVATIVRGLVSASSRHPEIVRLLVQEEPVVASASTTSSIGSSPYGGPWGRRSRSFGGGGSSSSSRRSSSSSCPRLHRSFALSALTGRVLRADVGSEEHARRHADRIVRTLFGDTSASGRSNGNRVRRQGFRSGSERCWLTP